MKALLVAAALSGCSLTPAQRTGTLATLATVSLGIDWLQTRDIVRECQELNPIIGECGQRVDPDVYFPIAIVSLLVTAYAIGGDAGDLMLMGVAGAQTATVWGNAVR